MFTLHLSIFRLKRLCNKVFLNAYIQWYTKTLFLNSRNTPYYLLILNQSIVYKHVSILLLNTFLTV